LFKRLVVGDQEYVKNWPKLQQMNECLRAKKYQEGLTAYRQLPSRMKIDKNVLLVRLSLAQNAGDQEYSEAIQDVMTNYPNDPCADFVGIDSYLLRNEFAKALESLEHLDAAVGGDPYLKVMRANVFAKSGNLIEARKACQKAIEEEPTLKEAYWSLVNVSLQEKKFDETVDLLTTLADKFQEEIGDLTNTPDYAEFVSSPEYQKWLKSREKD
jgi:thioredoxin-like negative regulator of GroEL